MIDIAIFSANVIACVGFVVWLLYKMATYHALIVHHGNARLTSGWWVELIVCIFGLGANLLGVIFLGKSILF